MGKGDRKHKKHKKKKENYIPPKKRQEKIIVSFGESSKNNTDDSESSTSFSNEDKKVSYEIIKEEIKYNEHNPIHFLKWSAKYNELDGLKIKDMDNFINIFPFAESSDKYNKIFKNPKNTEFALEWFKENQFTKKNDIRYFKIPEINFEKIKKLNSLPDINSLLPYSFILHAKIKLKSPYYSSDDDNFYLIQNPCLKEKVFKVPMVRGSGWKGVIARAGKELVNEDLKWFESYVRIFGTGSDEYRKLIDNLKKDKDISERIINYVLFELGLKLKKADIDQIRANPGDYLKRLSENFIKEKIINTPYLQPHKGSVIFYPTYFDKLSLEIINPHSRKTRAGTTPIHYEVVPEGTEGILQIVYIPFDGVLMKNEDLKTQVENDIKFLSQCIEKSADIGIGAKEKLGWGRFEFGKKIAKCNRGDIEIPEGWDK